MTTVMVAVLVLGVFIAVVRGQGYRDSARTGAGKRMRQRHAQAWCQHGEQQQDQGGRSHKRQGYAPVLPVGKAFPRGKLGKICLIPVSETRSRTRFQNPVPAALFQTAWSKPLFPGCGSGPAQSLPLSG